MNHQNFQNLMLLTSSDTKRTLMHLFLFTNSAQRELVSICTQSIHDRNKLSLLYILDAMENIAYDRFQSISVTLLSLVRYEVNEVNICSTQ